MKKETLEKEETIDKYINHIGRLLVSVFKKFNLKTHINCNFTNDKKETFVLSFRTEEYDTKQKERSYSEEDMKEAFQVGFNVGYNDETSPSYLTAEKFVEQFKKK